VAGATNGKGHRRPAAPQRAGRPLACPLEERGGRYGGGRIWHPRGQRRTPSRPPLPRVPKWRSP
jgi:hypothetical protein